MKLIEGVSKFFADVNVEMSKVNWPTYDELRSSTIVVIVLSLLFVVFIFMSDTILTRILKLIF